MKISIIAAIGPNRELGKNNKLLWDIPEDLERFRKITKNHVVIMGRKTFESIGKPLPNRTNIVITRDQNYKTPNIVVAFSLEEAINFAKEKSSFTKVSEDKDEIFIIGGGQIYEQGIKYADKLYLTIVEEFPAEIKKLTETADTFFPDYSDFKKVISEEKKELKDYKYTFLVLERW